MVRVYPDCLKVGMEVTLEPLESQGQRQGLLLDGVKVRLDWCFLSLA